MNFQLHQYYCCAELGLSRFLDASVGFLLGNKNPKNNVGTFHFEDEAKIHFKVIKLKV